MISLVHKLSKQQRLIFVDLFPTTNPAFNLQRFTSRLVSGGLHFEVVLMLSNLFTP